MPLCTVENLTIGASKSQAVVNNVSWHIQTGEALGLIGESGSGKSLSARALIGLSPLPILNGTIEFEGQNIAQATESEWRTLRGLKIGMVLQDSLASLNPLMSIGEQVSETIRSHKAVNYRAAKRETLALFDELCIPEPEKRYDDLPFQISGGQRQRVAIAIGICCQPKLLIADEPTTALDVTIQAQILELFKELRRKYQMAILLITHDMGVVAASCERVIVMQQGHIIETGTVQELFKRPQTAYTKQLIQFAKREL